VGERRSLDQCLQEAEDLKIQLDGQNAGGAVANGGGAIGSTSGGLSTRTKSLYQQPPDLQPSACEEESEAQNLEGATAWCETMLKDFGMENRDIDDMPEWRKEEEVQRRQQEAIVRRLAEAIRLGLNEEGVDSEAIRSSASRCLTDAPLLAEWLKQNEYLDQSGLLETELLWRSPSAEVHGR